VRHSGGISSEGAKMLGFGGGRLEAGGGGPCRRIVRGEYWLGIAGVGSFPFLSAGWAVAEEFSSAGLVAQWWEDFVEYPGVCFWVVFLVWV
jgi:hypothetical protein